MAGILDDIATAGRGIIGSVKRGAGAQIAQSARAFRDVGIDTSIAEAYGNRLIEQNPATINSLRDIGSNPVTALSETVASSAPAIASALGAAKVGQLAGEAIGGIAGKGNPGAIKAGGIAGGIIGQAVPDFISFYGGNRQAQDAQGIDSPGAAAIAAAGQSAINQVPLVPVKRLLRIPGATTAPAASILKEAGKFAAIGAASAPAQLALTRGSADQSLTENPEEYVKSAVEGGVMGAGLGAGAGAAERALAPTRDDMQAGHAISPLPTVIEPSKGPVSRATARGAAEGAIEGVINADHVRASLPVIDGPFMHDEMPQAPPAHEVAQAETPADYGGLYGDRPISIKAGKDLKPAERVVEQRAAQQVLQDPAAALDSYRKLPGTDNGRIISTDEARELFGDYSSGPDARSAFSFAVHEPASFIAKEAYADKLAQPVGDGFDPVVMFTAGGTGAGKSTAVKRIPGLKDEQDRADIIYDGNLQNFNSAKEKIEQALESGRSASILYVNRDPIESFTKGAIPRAAREDYGRTVPFDAHASTHIGAAKTIAQLAEHYKDNPQVDIRVVNNKDDVASVGEITDVSHIAGMDHASLVKELDNGLEQERSAGKVPDRVYNFYRPEGAQREAEGVLQGEGARQEAGRDGGDAAQQGQGEVAYPLAPEGTRYREIGGEDKLSQMTPDEFLAQSRPLEVDDASRDNIDTLKQHILDGKQLDPLSLHKDGTEDGRHRAIAAKELGIAKVPVDNQRTSRVRASVKDERWNKDKLSSVRQAMLKVADKMNREFGTDIDAASLFKGVTDKVGPDAPASAYAKEILASGDKHFSDAHDGKGVDRSSDFLKAVLDEVDGNNVRASERDLSKPVNGKGMAPRAVGDLVSRQTKNWKSGPAVEVVPTNADIPAAVREALGKKDVDGAYDGAGKIYIVADQVNSAKDIRRIIAHEAYAHYGVKGVLGAKFSEFLSKITALKDTDADIRAAYAATEDRYGGLSPEARADEVVAHLAENYSSLKGRAKVLVAQIVSAFKNFLRKTLNIQSEMSAKDVLATIAKAKRSLEKSSARERPMPTKKNVNTFDGTTRTEQDFAGARASVPNPDESFDGGTRPSAKLDRYLTDSAKGRLSAYLAAAGQKGDKLRTMFQDYFLPVRRTQEAIEARGGKIGDDSDVYGREELYYGRTGAKLDALERDHVKPLVEDLAKSGVSLDDAELYMYAKFAPERNARIAEINPEMQDGGSGMSNADAAKVLADFDAQPGMRKHLDRIADRVYALNEVRVKALEEGGLISKEEAKAWREDKHYVPLKGFADGIEDDAPQTRPAIGAGFSVGGKEAWRALGRKSRAADILANAIAQTDQAIIRSEKNRVAQALLKLAQDNPDKNLWEVDATQSKAGFDKNTGEVVYRTTTEPNAVIAKKDGVEYRINLYDQRLLEAMKNMGAAKVGAVLRSFGKINRMLSMTRTTLSPEFVLSNLARDIQTAATNITGKIDAKTAAKAVTVNMPHAMKAMWGQLSGKKVGGEWARWAQEFEDSGGMTHFVNQKTVEEQQAKIESLINRAKGKTPVRAMLGNTLEYINQINGTIENATRLSTYAEARKSGMSTEQAARLAKNITVNFNRKGQVGAALNAMFLFYNASIQGGARFLHAIKDPKVQGIMTATAAMGFGLGYYNRIVGGKDDDGQDLWDKVPDWEKERNLYIMDAFGKGNNLKIPMPYTYNLPYLIGQNASDMTFGKKTSTQGAAAIINAIVNAFDPVGSIDITKDPSQGIVKAASPTVLQPFVDIAFNKNFAGSPIKPEQDPHAKVPTPDSESYFKGSTNPGLAHLTRELNRLSGGNPVRSGGIDISPASMTYLFDYLTGGTGAFVERLATAGALAASGKEVPANKIPFARTFLSRLDDRRVNDTYYTARDDVNQKAEMAKAARIPGAFPDATENEREEMKFGLRLAGPLKTIEHQLGIVRKAKTAAQSRGDDAATERLDKTMRDLMLRFNRVYFAAKDSAA